MYLVQEYCAKKLNEEYYELCEKLVKKLSRKRYNPMDSGQEKIWAAAIVYTIASINYLFDKSKTPSINSKELNQYFETSSSTVAAKSKMIKDLLKIWHFDPEFTTREIQSKNPFNNLAQIDGLIMPMDSLPHELQMQVLEARAKGEDIVFTTQ